MKVNGYRRAWEVNNIEGLSKALAWRDSHNGAVFWLTHNNESFPALAIRISGDLADVHFFPKQGHAGFRSLGGLNEEGTTRLVYEGCDPAAGEETSNQFLIPINAVRDIAIEFFRSKHMSTGVPWFEL